MASRSSSSKRGAGRWPARSSAETPSEQIDHAKLSGPFVKVFKVEPASLDPYHAENIVVRHLTAFAKPYELGEDRILRAGDGELDILQARDSHGCITPTRELRAHELIRGRWEDVELVCALQMNNVEGASPSNGKLSVLGIGVEIGTQRCAELRCDLGRDIGHDIDIAIGRTPNEERNFQVIERTEQLFEGN